MPDPACAVGSTSWQALAQGHGAVGATSVAPRESPTLGRHILAEMGFFSEAHANVLRPARGSWLPCCLFVALSYFPV